MVLILNARSVATAVVESLDSYGSLTKRWPGHLGIPVEEVKTLHSKLTWRGRTLREKASGECVFFERGQGCTVYPVRPVQCRTWPFWQSNLKNKQIWDEVSFDCPGMGQGNLIPVEQIIARMREFKL